MPIKEKVQFTDYSATSQHAIAKNELKLRNDGKPEEKEEIEKEEI